MTLPMEMGWILKALATLLIHSRVDEQVVEMETGRHQVQVWEEVLWAMARRHGERSKDDFVQ